MTAGCVDFGQYLRALREARRLSLVDVERMTLQDAEPVSRSQLSRMETGQARLSVFKLLSLARVYGVRAGALIERLDIAHQLAKDEPLVAADGAGTERLLTLAREAGLRGQAYRALALYQRAQISPKGDEPEPNGEQRARAHLGVARSLLAQSRPLAARDLLERLTTSPLTRAQHCWTVFLLCRTYLQLEQHILARALLDAMPAPMPVEIQHHIPRLRAELQCLAGELDPAHASWIEALDLARAAADGVAEIGCLRRLAEVERRRGRPGEALDWAEKSRLTAEALGSSLQLAQAWIEIGRIQRLRSRADLARKAWNQARLLARRIDHSEELLLVYAELWRLARDENQLSEMKSCERTLLRLAKLVDRIPIEAREAAPFLEAPSGDAPTLRKEAR